MQHQFAPHTRHAQGAGAREGLGWLGEGLGERIGSLTVFISLVSPSFFLLRTGVGRILRQTDRQNRLSLLLKLKLVDLDARGLSTYHWCSDVQQPSPLLVT